MITVTAKFTGANGSMGFITGQRYKLELVAADEKDHKIKMFAAGKPEQYCPYCCIETFLMNWTDVKTLTVKGHHAN